MSSLRKHSKIKYSTDLTSDQIWKALNSLLFEAAAPLSYYGVMSVETALSCLALSTNNRRKISADNPDTLLTRMFTEISQTVFHDDPANAKVDLLEYMLSRGVERNIFEDHIIYSLSNNKLPKYIDRHKIRKHVGIYLSDYKDFKRDVVFRFYYFIQTSANKNHYIKGLSGLKSSQDEMFHVYVISAMRAIDKFVPFKGTLTSYIQAWFQNAEGSSDFMVYEGEAFSLNRNTRKLIQDGDKEINNKSIPIEDRENVLVAEDTSPADESFGEFSQHIAKLPGSTIMFLAQNLPYQLNPIQIKLIELQNAEAQRNSE